MDTQKKTQNVIDEEDRRNRITTRETCPTCGIRRRKSNCLVCLECNDPSNDDFGKVGRLKVKLEEKNEKAVLDQRFGDVVDVWDEIFKFVLKQGPKTVERKQDELKEAIELRDVRTLELRSQAERDVARTLVALGKGGNRAQYLTAKMDRDSLKERRFGELRRGDEYFKRVHGLGKCITALPSVVPFPS